MDAAVVTTMVIWAASDAAAPAHISSTAPSTARGGREAGLSRIRTAPLIRSADSGSPGRRWPSAALVPGFSRAPGAIP